MDPRRLRIEPAPVADVLALERELGVSHPLAQVLVRRGLGNVAAARAWIAADVAHDPSAFGGMDEAIATIERHLCAGSSIVVHGDYDVDGVCSTAIVVRALRDLGGEVGWYLPSRSEDGYGLAVATVERLAEQGAQLLVTVDCAITAVEAVEAARARGVDVVVTDHHTPRADGVLPDAPIVHPRIGGYPCPDLCAAGVAYLLARALYASAGRDPAEADADLDIVALATIADCVPLRDENRRLVRHGLRALAATSRPGLRALMAVSKCDPSAIDARACGFRLAPRINAAGRLRRADAGLELLLTDDPDRAEQIARELDDANAERRHVETRILFDAEAQVAALNAGHTSAGGRGEQPAAYVLAGAGWHPGVIGIVASRIAERHHRPTVLIALPERDPAHPDVAGVGTGSGRSIPAFDLLAGFDAAAEHLERHGGHRAAAGLTIAADSIDAFRAAFVAHAERVLTPADLVPVERVDAVVAGDELGLELAEELELLAPYGQDNPAVSLLVPSARLLDARTMGEGKHMRFTVEAGGVRARAVAFGTSRLPDGADGGGFDATFALELNEWNGAVEPRLRLRRLLEAAPAPIVLVGEPEDAVDAALLEATRPTPPALLLTEAPRPVASGDVCPDARDRRGGGIAGIVSSLVASGESVLVVCADARARRAGFSDRLGGFAICSWNALEHSPEIVASYSHVVALDPPAEARHEGVLRTLRSDQLAHLAWGRAELACSEHVHRRDLDLRAPLREIYVALRDAAGDPPEAGRGALEALASSSPVRCGRGLRVLAELGLIELDGRRAHVVAAPQPTERDRSEAFRVYARRLEEGLRWMNDRWGSDHGSRREAVPA